MAQPDDLRLHFTGRTRPVPGEFVLYWLQVTMRATENFALNYAIERANELGVPLLVYQGLRPDYPWASVRIHTFILESAIDLCAQFARRGIQYVFHLERDQIIPREEWSPESRRARVERSPLVQLARRSSLVVTDFYPTFIVPRQTRKLRSILSEAGCRVPLVAVDSATVVPMAYFTQAFVTARAIRPRLEEALPHYLHTTETPEPRIRRPVTVEFEPTDLDPGRSSSLETLIASCPVNRSVPPARSIRGGTQAARARLDHFLNTGLSRYTADRNDPNVDATSGMSPYLHFGNISPHEVLLAARQAGPALEYAKFQDQTLVWRELSHNFVYHDPRHRTVDAIPGWARKELEEHSADPRPALYSLAEMERAATGDALWNAAQTAYLQDGYMHNYLRMLWGKAILQWTPGFDEALRVMEHLNNKYSLDGRDPNSYGGIMWIFGKFDRPFYRRPIYGLVRYQSLTAAQRKFDVKQYIARYRAPTAQGALPV